MQGVVCGGVCVKERVGRDRRQEGAKLTVI